jgi:hypothetical protein
MDRMGVVYRADDGVRLWRTPLEQQVTRSQGEALLSMRRPRNHEPRPVRSPESHSVKRVEPPRTSRKPHLPVRDGALDPFGD